MASSAECADWLPAVMQLKAHDARLHVHKERPQAKTKLSKAKYNPGVC